MHAQPTTHSPGGHARDDLLRQARRLSLQTADVPRLLALVDANGRARHDDAALLRDVIAYLHPILKIVFQSREIELARTVTAGEIALRFVVRPDGIIVKYDPANNSDTASPVEFIREPGHLDAALTKLSAELMAQQTPIALAAADEIRMVCEALGTTPVSHG